MKQFAYFESTDGGMEEHYVSKISDLAPALRGWMERTSCYAPDCALIEWANNAAVGECFTHRLGVCVRLQDVIYG
jgi:hypothetical protein